MRTSSRNSVAVVSIRARHYWRAMPLIGQLHFVAEDVSIRARHYWRAMHAGLVG